VVDVAGGRINMVIGGPADFLDLIVEVSQLANGIIKDWVRISVILIAVSIAVILIGIFLVAHII